VQVDWDPVVSGQHLHAAEMSASHRDTCAAVEMQMNTWCKVFEQPLACGTLAVPNVSRAYPYFLIAAQAAARVMETKLYPMPGDHVDNAATLARDPHAESARVAAKVRIALCLAVSLAR
jgi:hypothetical protein